MMRSILRRVATLLAGVLALPLAIPASAGAQSNSDSIVYSACYIFTAGGDHTAMSFPPHAIDRHELYQIYPEARLQDDKTGAARANGYISARCNAFATPAKAEAWYAESGYRFTKRLDWPKGLWPVDKPGFDPRGPSTAGQQPPPPKVATAPKPSAPPALTVKTDTSIKDAAKAWDEQVKKTLAAKAQKKVEAAAKIAQSDAKLKADYEAFFAERRKQGRAQ